MEFGCCLSLGSFVPQVADEAKSTTAIQSVEQALRFLLETGFDFAEFTVGLAMNPPEDDLAALVGVVETVGLPVPAFNSFVPRHLPIVGPSRDLAALKEYVQEACVRMNQLGGEIVVLGSGAARRVPAGYAREAAQAELVEFLGLAADAATDFGITVVVEPLNKAETNLIHTVDEAVALAAETGKPNVRALADTYHMEKEMESVAVLRRLGAFLAHVHVADTDRRAPGTGTCDYRQLRSCLEAGGYTGRISVECSWTDFEVEAPATLATLRAAWSERQ